MLEIFTKSQKILGINARNQEFIKPSHFKRARCVIDNKLLTKRILNKAGIPTSKVYGIIKKRSELNRFNWNTLPNSFALKPNRGLGGAGILIVYGRKKESPSPVWIKVDGKEITIPDLKNHILNILDGNFSLNSIPDVVFFEERIKILKLFKPYAWKGIPDIRIIVYGGMPVMAEFRLPTKESDGRANLHAGAIGVGIDMGSGITTNAILYQKLISFLPKKRLILRGIKIPYWSEILTMAVQSQIAANVNFLGVDIAIDREKGPVVLELNARPGLSIQIANLAPLRERLERIKGLKIKNLQKRVKLAQDLFGGEVEEELEEISGRRVIGICEPIEVIDIEGRKHSILVKIDTGAYRTTICQSLADKFGLTKTIRTKRVRGTLGNEERPIVDLSFILDNRLVSTEAFVANRIEMKFDIIVGRKDLKQFLVDPAKNVFMSEKVLEKIKEKRMIK